jgi:hypothetical protein
MRIIAYHSHLNGWEWLRYHQPRIWQEIEDILHKVNAENYRTKESKETRKKGQMLFSPYKLNQAIERLFRDGGWREYRVSYWVTDDYQLIRRTLYLPAPAQKKAIRQAGRQAIYSYNQTDFFKDRVAVEIQMGKYSFVAYDLFIKHLSFYTQDVIDVGIEILPMKEMQRQMSSGIGYYEGALYDLARHGRGVPAVPLILVGIAP